MRDINTEKPTNDIDCSHCKYTSPGCLGVLCEVGGRVTTEKTVNST